MLETTRMLETCEDGDTYSDDSSLAADGSGPISRSSVTHVAYIVAKFDVVKKELVREIGFSGILELPQITKVDRKFTFWLLSVLDPDKRSFLVNGQYLDSIIDFEAARIMGIPCGRRKVCPLVTNDKKSKVDFIQNLIGCPDSESNSLVAAEKVVKNQYDSLETMSQKDKDNFKVSFVVWVMGHLLAPTKKHNVGSDRFWGALLVTDDINQFNWALYVIDELINAARDVQNSIKQDKAINTITGCAILLQILYFEMINMGTLNRPRDITPRVKAYDGKSLNLMIAADKASTASGSGSATWGSIVRNINCGIKQSIHLSSQKIGPDSTENEIITDLGKYLRAKFGDKVSTEDSIAFNWFHARCMMHLKRLRISLQQDTIALVGKLFGNPNINTPPIASEAAHSKLKGARPALSEPAITGMYARSAIKNKRGYESSSSFSKRQSTKRRHVSFSQPVLCETLLTGITNPCETEPRDEQSESGCQSRTASHNSGFNIEIPSFDLGIEFNDEAVTGIPAASLENLHVDPGNDPPQETMTINDKKSASTSKEGWNKVLSRISSSGNHVELPNNTSPGEINENSKKCQVMDSCSHGTANVNLISPLPGPSLGQKNADISGLSVTNSSDFGMSFNDDESDASGRSKFANTCALSDNDYSDNSISFSDEKCPGSSTPTSLKTVCKTAKALSCITPPAANTGIQSRFTTPDQRIKNSSVSPKSLSKLFAEADLIQKITHSEDSPDKNIKPWDEGFSHSPVHKRIIYTPVMNESPFSNNLHHRSPPQDIVDKFFHDVSACDYSTLNRPWLCHSCPQHIEVDGTWIHKCFILQTGLTYDVCDLLIRRFRQLDDIMYTHLYGLHWRHILESEFAISALAGEIPYNRKAIIEQFVGSSLQYKLEECRMIVVPAYILLNWSCYFFDFKENRVHVIDPLFNNNQAEVFNSMHCPNVSKVAESLMKCFDTFFVNWHPNLQAWDLNFIQPPIVDATSAETGMLTLMYIRQFDGCKIRDVNRESFLYFKKLMLYELMCLNNNHAKALVNPTISLDE